VPKNDQTRIIMSFAMAAGGARFGHWLRDRLMKEFGFYAVDAVYMDCVVARSGQTEHGFEPVAVHGAATEDGVRPGGVVTGYTGKGPTKEPVIKLFNQPDRMSVVTPDGGVGREHVRSSTKARPIGAMTPSWDAAYQEAMASADVMIFAATPEWNASPWCQREANQFKEENGRRVEPGAKSGKGLAGIALEFDGTKLCFTDDRVIPIPVTKTKAFDGLGPGKFGLGIAPIVNPGVVQGVAWDVDDWVLNETDFQKLAAHCGMILGI
jgi:hypothetical protein